MNRLAWILILLVVAGLAWLAFGANPNADATAAGDDDGATAARLESAAAAGEDPALPPAATTAEGAARSALAPTAEELASAAVAAATAPASLRLRLVDAAGQPVREIEVKRSVSGGSDAGDPALFRARLLRTRETETPATSTAHPDADGVVTLDRIAPGLEQRLVVSGDFWVRRSLRVAPLLAGEQRDLGELVLSPGLRLAGRVTHDGAGVAGAQVKIESDGERAGFVMVAGGPALADSETDHDGSYALPGVPPGRYRLTAEAAGMVATTQVVEFGAAPREPRADLALGTGGRVRGRVLDASGKPLPSARVAIVPAGGFGAMSWHRQRVLSQGIPVGADGRFELTGLPEQGQHRVLAAAEGHALGRSPQVSDGAAVELALDAMTSVSGRVLDGAGRPVAEAEVRLDPVAQSTGPLSFGTSRATSGADGSFRLEGVAPGDYALVAEAMAGEARIEPFTVAAENEPVELRLAGGGGLIVRVQDEAGLPLRDAEVALRRAASDLRPFDDAGQRIRIVRGGDGPARSARTDARGEVHYLGLPPGNWEVEADAEGFARTKLEVQRAGEGEQTFEVVLRRSATLVVRVVDPFGGPVPGAQLELRRDGESSGKPASRRADDWGIAVWEELEPGRYGVHQGSVSGIEQIDFGDGSVRIGRDGGGRQASEVPSLVVDLAGGQVREEELVIAAQTVLRVRVTRFGEAVAGASVELKKPGGLDSMFAFDGQSAASARSDGDGWASLPPCEPGSYILNARASLQNPPTEIELDLLPGAQERGIALASGELSGRVVGPAGALGNARVRLGRNTGDGQRSAMVMSVSIGTFGEGEPAIETIDMLPGQSTVNTAPDGSFRFTDVPAGDWSLQVQALGHAAHETDSVHLDDGGRVDVGLIELEGAGSLRGRVIGLPAPEPGGWAMNLVRLASEDGGKEKFTAANAEGGYSFADVPPGNYRLRMDVNGEMKTSGVVRVTAGPPTVFDFQL